MTNYMKITRSDYALL